MSTYPTTLNLRQPVADSPQLKTFDPLPSVASPGNLPGEPLAALRIPFFTVRLENKLSVLIGLPDWRALKNALQDMERLQVALGGRYMNIAQAKQRARSVNIRGKEIVILSMDDWQQLCNQIEAFLTAVDTQSFDVQQVICLPPVETPFHRTV